ncbi:Hypothetical predicted protein, partial [Paramuricea clavata]
MPPKSKAKAQTSDNNDEQDEYIFLSTVKALMAQQESAFKSMIDSLFKTTTAR